MAQMQVQEDKREMARQIALRNLSGYVGNLAAVFLSNNQYGPSGDSAVDQFIYRPSIKGPGAADFVLDEPVKSRKGPGKETQRYGGSITEMGLLASAHQIMQESFAHLKFQDVIELMGSNLDLPDKYKDKYLSDLASTPEGKKIVDLVASQYSQYLVDSRVSEALAIRTEFTKKNLEKILSDSNGVKKVN